MMIGYSLRYSAILFVVGFLGLFWPQHSVAENAPKLAEEVYLHYSQLYNDSDSRHKVFLATPVVAYITLKERIRNTLASYKQNRRKINGVEWWTKENKDEFVRLYTAREAFVLNELYGNYGNRLAPKFRIKGRTGKSHLSADELILFRKASPIREYARHYMKSMNKKVDSGISKYGL